MNIVVNELGDFVFYTGDAFDGPALDTYGIHYLNRLNELGIHAVTERILNIIAHNLSSSNSTTEVSRVNDIRQLSQIERYEG